MKYLVHINPTPGSDLREVEVEAAVARLHDGALIMCNNYEGQEIAVAFFSPSVWNYVEPKK